MFPQPPRRPRSPFGPPMPPRRPYTNPTYSNQSKWLAMIQDDQGKIDLEKVSLTAKQINDIYGQISPLIGQFKKR